MAEIIVDESDWGPLPSEVARREKVPVRVCLNETWHSMQTTEVPVPARRE
jgi:hypothetical protein